MHREIQIKQFPIVTTHWWPKTRNERFLSDLSAHTHPVCDVCVRVLWLTLHSHGASASTLDGGHVWSVVLTRRHSLLQQPITYFSGVAWTGLGICMRRSDWLTPPLALEKLRQHHASDTPSVKRWRRRPVYKVTMGNCLIWISLCMFFFPLIETVTYTCHYMTDRLERFDLKTSKLDLLKKKKHLHLGCPWGKLIDTKF